MYTSLRFYIHICICIDTDVTTDIDIDRDRDFSVPTDRKLIKNEFKKV